MSATDRVIAARAALILDQPFFGVLALQLTLVSDTTCETAWTNGRTLGFNPAFVDTLTAEQLTALIAHEVLHCACGHPWRRDGRDPDRWNQACDYAINSVVRDAGFILPDGALMDAAYDGRHAEYIFDRLPQPKPQQPGAQPGAQPGNPQGEVRDAPADTDPDALSESDWKEITTQAQAMARGTLTAGATRGIDALKRPIVDWRSALRRFLQSIAMADYTWTRPNTRYLASGLFLPSMRSDACGTIVVAIDTSGSIDTVLLSQFESELRSIVDELKPRSVHVIYCDSSVCGAAEFGPDDSIDLVPCGGGGTRFAPVFDHVDSEQIDPVALVYMTDLDGPMPDAAPAYPVLWASTAGYDRGVPFGEVIPLV